MEEELEVLFYLVCARLCINVTMCAYHKKLDPDNKYIPISEKSSWLLLEKLTTVNPEYARRLFRQTCQLPG